MMKKLLCTFLFLTIALSLVGCGKTTDNFDETNVTTAPAEEETQEPTEPDYEAQLYADFTSPFVYATGVGGWGESFTVNSDGTFTGEYHDSDKGSFAPEYMMGIVYKSEYSGSFKEVTKINDYTFALEYNALSYTVSPGTEKIEDDYKYSYCGSRGLSETNTVYLYTPSAKVADLPEYYQDWVIDYCDKNTEDTLGFYGIYNEEAQACFVSENK